MGGSHLAAIFLIDHMNFGIDFGTTNTAVSRMDGNEPVPLTFGDAQQPYEYVPSVMALRGGARPCEDHGRAAKERIGEPDFEVYQNFKMLLGEPPERIAAHWGSGLSQTPEAITHRFIARLLEQIKAEHGLNPARVVVTVPEVWLVQNLQTKREHLINGFKRQGIRRVEVRSEPVAAATYYLHCFKRKKGQPFQGHLLVCDCGGGTMDFCLVGVESGTGDRPRMTVLERAGNGMVNGRIGSAGVAFDQAVIDRLFPGLKERDQGRYFRRAREFEQRKITHAPTVTENLALHRQNPEAAEGERLFSLADGEVSVEPKHLAEVFAAVIEPAIREALDALLARIRTHAVALDDPSRFRVLMVGGFSSFYLVPEAIKDAFGRVLSTDQRFEEVLLLADRALAISKGAALIANDLAEIVETCPANVGIEAIGADAQRLDQVLRFPILKKSVPIQKYQAPVWEKTAFVVANPDDRLPLYVETIPGRPLSLNLGGESLRQILPIGLKPDARVQIGFSVDADLVFSIHIRNADNHQQARSTTLGSLMARLPGLMVA